MVQRILVTGREGQIARSLARFGLDQELVFAARPEFDLADFASIEAMMARVRPDLVVSAAAYTAVDRAEEEPELAMRHNGEAPGVLARAAANVGAKVIHLSTDYVFSGGIERAWREDDPVDPINIYGRSKALGEQAIAESGAEYVILRTAWVYSPFGSNFVKTMLRLAQDRDEISVVSDQFGNPTSADEIARGIGAITGKWQPGIFHLAGTGDASWADFAKEILAESEACGGPVATVEPIMSCDFPTKAARPSNSRLDCSKFAEAFAFRPQHWKKELALVVREILKAD